MQDLSLQNHHSARKIVNTLATALDDFKTDRAQVALQTLAQLAKSPTAKVLIVDDQPVNIRVLMSALQDDYAVIAATNATKATELAMTSPQPDLILLDVMMPDISGYQLCEQF